MGGMLYLIAQIYLCGSCVYVGDKTSYIYISIVWVCVCVEALRGQTD